MMVRRETSEVLSGGGRFKANASEEIPTATSADIVVETANA
jgi:hypothetical protein